MAGGPDLVVRVAANIEALRADMTRVQASIKAIETTAHEASAGASAEFAGLKGAARDLATDFLAMFTARAAFNFVKSTIDEASALKDLSQQTHITVEEIQVLAGGMSEFGVDADTLAKGLYRLSRGIAGGEDSVARGLHQMGLGLKDVEGLNGEALFLKIMHGLSMLQGGLRDDTAAQLFGGKLGMAMAGASDGIEGAIETWRRMNHVAGTEAVDELDKFGEAITRANKSLGSLATNMLGPVAEGLNVLFDTASHGASLCELAMGLLPKGLGLVGTGTEGLAKLIDDLNQKTDANAKATAGASAAGRERVVVQTAEQQAAKFMAALEADVSVALTAAQLTNLGHLKEIGALTAQNAAAIGVNASQFARYTASIEAAKKAASDLAAVEKETEAFRQVRWKQQLDMEVKIIASTDKQTAAYLKLRNEGVIAELEAQTALNKVWGLDASGAIAHEVTAIETLEAKLRELQILQDQGQDTTKRVALAQQEFGDALMKAAVADDTARNARAKGNTELAKTPAVAASAGSSIDTLADTFNRAAGVVIGGLTGIASAQVPRNMRPGENPIETAAEFVSRTIRNGRQGGGPVSAGSPYVVGERGPELFVPSQSGSIVPSGGSAVTHNHFYFTQPLGTPSAIAAAVKQALAEDHRSSGGRMPVGV